MTSDPTQAMTAQMKNSASTFLPTLKKPTNPSGV